MSSHRSMRALRAAVFASLLVLLPAAVRAQPSTAGAVLRLGELLRQLQEDNPTLRAAHLEAEALATRGRQVSALPDPAVMAGYRPFAVGGLDGAVPGWLTVQQMFPYPGKLRLAGEAAAHAAEQAAHEVDALVLDLAFQVKSAYYELYRIQEQDRLIRVFQEQLEDFEEAAAVRYEVGQGMQQAILKAQLEGNTLARRRLQLAAMRRTQLERIARLTNRPALAAGQERLVLERAATGFSAGAAPEAALHTRPEARALRAGLEEADARIALARRDYRPDFTVGVGFMDRMGMEAAADPLDDLGRRFGIEAGIVLPLQRGRRGAALEEARLRRRQLEARYEALQTEIQTEFHKLQHHLEEAARALALYESTLLPQAETSLEATLSAYTTGRTDFLDLLDAERMLFDLRMEYEETYAGYLQMRAALERALGTPVRGEPEPPLPSPSPAGAGLHLYDLQKP